MLKAIAPVASDRFTSANEFLAALRALPELSKAAEPEEMSLSEIYTSPFQQIAASQVQKLNYNPYVSYLLTLYSQSQHTNAGTRGLDKVGEQTYIPTLLD